MPIKYCFLLLAIAAFAFLASSGPARGATDVSACMALTSADTNYNLNRSLVDENVTDQGGWCIGINADNITFDCQGFVIANSTLAISGIYSNSTGTVIRNCYVTMENSLGGVGIMLARANDSRVLDSTLDSQYQGLYISHTENATIQNVTATSNTYGITLWKSFNSTLTLNNMSDNVYNFYISATVDRQFDHTIGSSNTVDHSYRILYNHSVSDYTFDPTKAPDTGTIVCASCENVTYRDFDLSHDNFLGIYLFNTNDSKILNVTASSNYNGIAMSASHDSTIDNITASSNNQGIYLYRSTNNTIVNSTVRSNAQHSIFLTTGSYDNLVANSTVRDCSSGGTYACIYIFESDGNLFAGNRINGSSGYGIEIASFGSGDHSSHNVFRDTNITGITSTAVRMNDASGSSNLNNTFLNCTYDDETVDANSQLIRKWHYRTLVTFPSGDAAAGISVNAFNSSGILIENLTSGISGWTQVGSLIDYVNSGGTTNFYSNYTINASATGHLSGSKMYNVSITLNNISDIVSLGRFYSFVENSSLNRPTWSLAVADLNNDGQLDYIAGNYNEMNSIYINNGLGSFANTESSGESDATYSIAAADLNNDGYIDYIAGNYGQPNRVYLNDGSGSFTLYENSIESNNTRSIAIADLNNDGYVDYIGGNSYEENCIYINNGSGNFNLLEISADSESTFTIGIGDLNSDGYLDYINGNYNQPNRIYINNGSGHFTSLETSAESDTTRSLAIADLNNDGHLDYIAGNEPSPSGYDRAYINNGSGHFTLNYTSPTQSSTYGLAIIDINHDGHLDFIAASVGPSNNRIYLNNGLANFSLYENSEKKNATNSVAVGDFDRDGDMDYIGGNNGENNIYYNNGNGNDYIILLIKGTSPAINRDAIGTRVYASMGGSPVAYRDVTAADSSRDGAIELHFGLESGKTYDINATFATGRVVSCSITPPFNFTLFENGTSTNGASCFVVDFPPDILLMLPSDSTATMEIDIDFTCEFSDDNMLTNVTIHVWNSTNDVHYTDTKAVSGTSNQSNWTLLSMTPDIYMWNCLVADNASKTTRQPMNYSLRIVIKNSLVLKLVLNNTDSMVYIPGVGEQNSSTLGYQFYGNPEHYYLASYLDNALSGLVFSMRIPKGISVGRNASEGTHYIAIDQYMDDSRVFLVHTQGNWREIESRIAMIETGRFLTNILPSFSYGLGNRYSLDLALGYADIDLQGKLRLRKGTHKIVLENNGTSGGKPIVVISRG